MRDLNFQLRMLCLHSKEDSFATQAKRLEDLLLVANQLHDLGFKRLSVNGLKPKHVLALVALWKKHGVSIGTMKNRLSYIRWWANKIGKFDMLPSDNFAFGIDDRQFVSNVSKAVDLLDASLDKISDPFIKASLQLQAAFGLRREESIKFIPSWADRGDKIVLRGSWCKGGRMREIPIVDSNQRCVLDNARLLAGFGSLIPPSLLFIQQLKLYEYLTAKAGLFHLHGLRHNYAQKRYFSLTGWLAPADGGPSKDSIIRSSELSPEQKLAWCNLDNQARLTISNELGHYRESVTAIYLGR
jgi:hypothetical protein